MSNEELTPEERAFGEKLDEQLQQAQQKLDKIGMTRDLIQKLGEQKQQKQEDGQAMQEMADRHFSLPSIDRKGRKILSNTEIKENFANSFPIIRYIHLPICWSNFTDKLIIMFPLAFMGAYTFEALQLKRINMKLIDMKWKLLLRSYGITMFVGAAFCAFDSYFFDDFCDIDSHHYRDFDRQKLMRELRDKLKK